MAHFMVLDAGGVPSFFDDAWGPVPEGSVPVTQAQVDHYLARQPYAHWDAPARNWVDEPIPQPSPAPTAISGDAIIGAIAKADRAKVDPLDFTRIAWRDDVPASNAKLGRIAKALGTTPDALRQAGVGS